MFEVILIGLYALGFVLSGAFVLSWAPLAIKARVRRVPSATTVRIVDYMGFEVAIFAVFGFLLWYFTTEGVRPPEGTAGVIGRLGLPIVLNVFLAIRLLKWGRQWRGGKAGTSTTDPFEGLSRGGDS